MRRGGCVPNERTVRTDAVTSVETRQAVEIRHTMPAGRAGGGRAPGSTQGHQAGALSLGRVFGTPVSFHWSWLLILTLIGWSLAMGYFPFLYRRLTPATYWALGGISVVLLCASVLAHELAHALMARRHGIPVRGITFFAFGGAAQIAGQPRTPAAEFQIAVVGPLTSLALAGLFAFTAQLDQLVPYLAIPSDWLVRTNLVLALFNLLPGFPLDGGRIFRALVWHFSGDAGRATRVAGVAGQMVAGGLIGWGLFTAVTGGLAAGAWQMFLGVFLFQAAGGQAAQSMLEVSLRRATAGELARGHTVRLPGYLSLTQLVQGWVLLGGHRHFLVELGGGVAGVLSLAEIRHWPRERWVEVTAAQAMVPLEQLRAVMVAPQTPLLDALQLMDDSGVDFVLVVDGERVADLLSRARVTDYLRLRSQFEEGSPPRPASPVAGFARST
jgi:Zn-dependent protease